MSLAVKFATSRSGRAKANGDELAASQFECDPTYRVAQKCPIGVQANNCENSDASASVQIDYKA